MYERLIAETGFLPLELGAKNDVAIKILLPQLIVLYYVLAYPPHILLSQLRSHSCQDRPPTLLTTSISVRGAMPLHLEMKLGIRLRDSPSHHSFLQRGLLRA